MKLLLLVSAVLESSIKCLNQKLHFCETRFNWKFTYSNICKEILSVRYFQLFLSFLNKLDIQKISHCYCRFGFFQQRITWKLNTCKSWFNWNLKQIDQCIKRFLDRFNQRNQLRLLRCWIQLKICLLWFLHQKADNPKTARSAINFELFWHSERFSSLTTN